MSNTQTGHREKLLALAARVEAGVGEDRELDAEIVAAITPGIVGIDRSTRVRLEPEWIFVFDPPRRRIDSFVYVPAFTASIEAAATLMPADWSFDIHYWPSDTEPARCSVRGMSKDGSKRSHGFARGEPRARTAAGLLALAELHGPLDGARRSSVTIVGERRRDDEPRAE